MELMEREALAILNRDLDLFSHVSMTDMGRLRLGLYPPLCVTETALVWGFPLLSAAKREGIDRLWCVRVCCDDFEALRIALSCEGRKNAYTTAEKAGIAGFLKKKGIIGRAGEIAPLVQDSGNFLLQADLYNSIPAPVRLYVDENLLDLKHAASCFGTSRKGALPESVLVDNDSMMRRLTFSERREFLTLLKEIVLGRAEGERDAEILSKVLADCSGFKKPLERLKSLRFPGYAETVARFEGVRDRLFSGSGITLTAPPNFEGSSFTVTFSFSSGKALARAANRLAVASEHADDLFGLLR